MIADSQRLERLLADLLNIVKRPLSEQPRRPNGA